MSAKDKKAGPPKCKHCGALKQMWIPAANRDKVPPYDPFLWLCPNYCELRYSVNPETFGESRKLEQDVENPMIGMLPDMESPIVDINNQTCPHCGNTERYRIIFTDDSMTEVDYFDCMMCHTHWNTEGENLGRY